jgi:hypothetical protein
MSELILNTEIKVTTGRMYISIPKNKKEVVKPKWKLGTEVFAELPDGTYLLNGIVEAQKPTMWWFKIPAEIRHDFGLEKGDDVLVYVEGDD